MDDWSAYSGYIAEAEIPAGKIVAYPFTANAAGQSGRMKFTTNSGFAPNNMTFKAWFSELPGGDQLDSASGCNTTVREPNPAYLSWQQSSSTSNRRVCGLGTAERTLYLNVEVACHTDIFGCTPGERSSLNYYVETNNTDS